MTSENPNNDPPTSFQPQKDCIWGSNEVAGSSGITNNLDDARADHMSIQHTLRSDSCFSFSSTHGPPHSDTRDTRAGLDSTMTNTTESYGFQNSPIDGNFIDLIDSIPVHTPLQCFPCSGERLKENCESDMYGGIVCANNPVDDSTHLNNFYNNQNDWNILSSRDSATRGIHIPRHSGDTNGSIRRMQIEKNNAGCGASSPVSHHTPESRLFAIGGCMEAIPEFSVPIREITHGSEWATPLLLDASIGQQVDRSSLNPAHGTPGGFSSLQSNASGFLALARNVNGWTSSNNNQRIMTGSYGLSSSPSQNLPTQQVDMQHRIPMPSNESLVPGGSRDARSLSTDDYMGVQNYLAAASGPCSASQGHLSDYGQVRLPGLTSESAHTTRITTQQSSEQPQYWNFLPDSSLISPFTGVHKSSARQDKLGQPFPAGVNNVSQVAEGGMSLRRMGVPLPSNLWRLQDSLPLQHFKDLTSTTTSPAFSTGQLIPAAKGNMHTQAFDVLVGQLQKKSSDQSPPVNSENFGSSEPPNFLGPTSSLGPVFPSAKGTEVGQASNAHVGSSHKRKAIRPPQAIAPIQRRKTTPLTSTRPSVPTAEQNAPSIKTVPAPYVKRQGPVILPAKETEAGQASIAHAGSSLKRKEIRPPQAIPRVQRRKTTPLPSTQPSVPTADRNAPSIKTAPALYIKRQGSDKHCPRPKNVQIGVECRLCNKDLSYKPEGQPCHAGVPPILPDVAILPCGHAFHDHCLQLITPQDQLRNPPCIPCAIDES